MGKQIQIKNLTDSHLANILDFITHNNPLREFLLKIAEERGLSGIFLNRSQIPYKNENNNWEIYTENGFEEISHQKN